MDSAGARWTLAKSMTVVLPAISATVFLLTMIAGEKAASGGQSLFLRRLSVSLPLVARDDLPIVVTVGILGIAWWYFLAQIGWSSRRGRTSRTGSALGALLIFFFCLVDAAMMFSEFSCCISQEPNFSAIDTSI
jgi:hypothetical protein